MAKSKKRASVRREKAARRSKAPQRVKGAVKKTAKQSAVRAKRKKVASKASAKRLTPSRLKPPPRRTHPPIEVIKVETVDQPAPGTVVVTEYEEVRVTAGGSTAEKSKQTGMDLPDPEDD
jgi:hypothetical protein